MKKVFVILLSTLFIVSCIPTSPRAKSKRVVEVERPISIPASSFIEYEGFSVFYNEERRIPNYVFYELTAEETNGQWSRKGLEFKQDHTLSVKQADDCDYRRSGWSRGHMAPAADFKWDATAMKNTFYYTNICPQDPTLNRRAWATLEKKVRDWANLFGRVYVVTGPVVGQNRFGTIGIHKVVVPDALFKAILAKCGEEWISIAFVMENTPEPKNQKKSAVTVNEVERMIKLDLFDFLDDECEEIVESQLDYRVWRVY